MKAFAENSKLFSREKEGLGGGVENPGNQLKKTLFKIDILFEVLQIVHMNRKRLVGRNFSFMWEGVVHLEDGSRWYLVDPALGHDVIWWETGEPVELVRNRGGIVIRNVPRDESVSVVEAHGADGADGEVLKLAA